MQSYRAGHLFGVPLLIHPSFGLLLAGLVVAGWQGAFAGPTRASLLLITGALGCVLLHELGHVLTARRFGVRGVRIVLYVFGGIALLRKLPEARGASVLVSLAGPAVNACVALGLAALLGLAGRPLGFGAALDAYRLGGDWLPALLWVNVAMTFVNLVPFGPLDGGQALRAWREGE